MAIILDADVIIRGEKGDFDLPGWLTKHATEEFEIAAITVAELWHGVERAAGERRLLRERYLNAILAPLPVVPYTEEVAREHARVWAELETAGKMSGYYDLIVAATARHRSSQLATFNRKHFENVVGLVLVDMAGGTAIQS
jgi:tRNA(fMet)-specific endonuclease VapC